MQNGYFNEQDLINQYEEVHQLAQHILSGSHDADEHHVERWAIDVAVKLYAANIAAGYLPKTSDKEVKQ